jgi:uncharacterized protein
MLRHALQSTAVVVACTCALSCARKTKDADNHNDSGLHEIQGIDCNFKANASTQDAYGNFSADGVRLTCDGQIVKLTDNKIANYCLSTGKVCDGSLNTADFGKLTVKVTPPFNLISLFVTTEQNRALKKSLAPSADLLSAAHYGDIARVKSLLAAKAELNGRDAYEKTPLMLACGGLDDDGHLEVVRALLAAGAEVNARDQIGATALTIAVNGWPVERKAQVIRTSIIQALIAAKADVNAASEDGNTPLLWTARYNQVEVVKALLVAGADVNHKDNVGDTALMVAALFGQLGVAQALLAAGANVDPRNTMGETALTMASQHGHTDIAHLLENERSRSKK